MRQANPVQTSPKLSIAEYERLAATTAAYPDGSIYPYLGLVEEVGEVAGVLAKAERDNGGVLDGERREQLKAELGDVLWMLTAVARDVGRPISSEHKEFFSREVPLPSSDPEVLVGPLGTAVSEMLSARTAEGLPYESLLLVVFWRWSNLCYGLGFRPVDVAASNLEKLASRKRRGVIHGSGDTR